MERLEEVLRELNQEMIETRNLTIKSDNSIRNLAGEIRELSREQERFKQRTVINSVTAYVLFALLSFGGLFLFFRASMSEQNAEKRLAAESERGLETRVKSLEAELERRQGAERAAYDFYQLLANGSKEEVVERFPEVQGSLIDRATVELFRREVDRIRQELADEAYSEGAQAFDDKRYEQARDSLLSSLSYKEFAPYTPDLHYQLGESLYQLEDHSAAARYFNLAIESNQLSSDREAIAYYHRAEALRNLGRDREALRAFRAFVQHFPNHPWRSAADARASMLANRVTSD